MGKTKEIIAPKVRGFYYHGVDVLALSLVEIFPIMEKSGATFNSAARTYFDLVRSMSYQDATRNSYTQCIHQFIRTFADEETLDATLQRFTQIAFENFRTLYTLYSHGKYLEMMRAIMGDTDNIDFDTKETEVIAYV